MNIIDLKAEVQQRYGEVAEGTEREHHGDQVRKQFYS